MGGGRGNKLQFISFEGAGPLSDSYRLAVSSVPPLTDYLSGRSWLNCNSKLEVAEAIILMSSLIPLSKRELKLPSASEVIKTVHQERKESDS